MSLFCNLLSLRTSFNFVVGLPVVLVADTWKALDYSLISNPFYHQTRSLCPRLLSQEARSSADMNMPDYHELIHRILVAFYSTVMSFHLILLMLSNLFPNCCCLWNDTKKKRKRKSNKLSAGVKKKNVNQSNQPAWNKAIWWRRRFCCWEKTASSWTAVFQQALLVFGTEHFLKFRRISGPKMRCEDCVERMLLM